MIPTDVLLLHPGRMIFVVPLLALLILLLWRDFVRTTLNPEAKKARRRQRVLMLITRTIIIFLLVLAITEPQGHVVRQTQGTPRVLILLDNSSSMDVLDTRFVNGLHEQLDARIPTQLATLGSAERSDIGNGILSNLEQDSNILLITDGNINAGPTIGDVTLYARGLNSSISAISLEPRQDDAAITLIGPTKTVADVENPFKAVISSTDPEVPRRITIEIDGQTVVDQTTTEPEIEFRRAFTQGRHEILARISPTDYQPRNTIARKVVTVVPKPKVLLVTQKDDPLKLVLDELYEVDTARTLPTDLAKYYAVIVNDVPVQAIGDTRPLTTYLNDVPTGGNGLLVIGGQNSFDHGGYENSVFETLLPVKVGTGTRKSGDANLAMVIDISGASGQVYEKRDGKLVAVQGLTSLDITKALAVSVLDGLELGNKVGVVAFASDPYRVADIEPLYNNKYALRDKISRLQSPEFGGQSVFSVGIDGAYQLLTNAGGDKNIIIFTDGRAHTSIQDQTISAVRQAAHEGVKTYVIGVGVRKNVDDAFLTKLAAAGNGIYFPADQSNKIKILFGAPTEIRPGETFGIFILDTNHFITKNLEIQATMNGFNQVVPKAEGTMLATSTAGDPAISVGRFGLGRVATITVFSGQNLGQLLTRDNNRLLVRTINWAIGDPERKASTFVYVEDTHVNEPTTVRVRSPEPLQSEMDFAPAGENIYVATFTPSEEGFAEILGVRYAVNYPAEYEHVGVNQDFLSTIQLTGGQLFAPDDVEGIIQHATEISRRTQTETQNLAWYLVAAALAVYMIEIIIRRLAENRLSR